MILQGKISIGGQIASKCDIKAFPCDFSPRLSGGDDYHEVAAKQAADRAAADASWRIEKARRAAMKPAEWALLKPALQDPINDPRGD
jgi:hypothetical protein